MPPMQQLMLRRALFRTRQVPSNMTHAWSGGAVCPWCAEMVAFKHLLCFLIILLPFSLSRRSMTPVCAPPGFQPLPPVCTHFDSLYQIASVCTGFYNALFCYESFDRSCPSSWRVRSAGRNVPLYKTNHKEIGVFPNAQCLGVWSSIV